jgi:HEAT repeat protein
VVIKPSAAQEVRALIADLIGQDPVRREAAVARLAVIGSRAVERLVTVVRSPAAATARTGALTALESIGDVRGLEPSLASLDDADTSVVLAAIGVARTFLCSPEGAPALDRLIGVALDASRDPHVRLAAIDALAQVPGKALAPVWKRLGQDKSAAVRQRARRAGGLKGKPAPEADVAAAAEGSLPDDPAQLQRRITAPAGALPLPTLHRLVAVIREREEREARPEERARWRVARGTAHQALAVRGSRVALYDLRETIETTDDPLPVEFLAAASAIGDATCLEPIARACHRAAGRGTPGDWWTTHLAEAFREIVRRERITARHAVVKRIRTRWPDAAILLFGS